MGRFSDATRASIVLVKKSLKCEREEKCVCECERETEIGCLCEREK